MTPLEHALDLAARGFFVFPTLPKGVGYRDRNGKDCISDGKHPAISGWQDWATRDPKKIEKRWGRRAFNVAISTSRFAEDKALVVVDVDRKKGKRGDLSLLQLELDGLDFPPTLEHQTPTLGSHLVYVTDAPLRQGTDVLGEGLDIRSKGGFIVAPGSEIDGVPYQQISAVSEPAQAPEWLVTRLGLSRKRSPSASVPVGPVDEEKAEARARVYLETAPVAVEGESGDQKTYTVAARLKDFGCTENQAVALMAELWNDRCCPPWSMDELATKVGNAFRYGKDAPGISAPEAVFREETGDDLDADEEPKGVHPIDKLNLDYAFVKRGAYVLQETTDEKGRYATERLSVDAFHAWHANQPLRIGEKTKPISKWWMESPRRRQYEGVVFMPQQNPGPRWYNLWQGFATQPATQPASHPALDAFLEHARVNVCRNNKELFTWLMGYFAHMIQRPWEKPLVALVFKGRKGTGKNALVERVGALLGPHFLVADDSRYLLSNFNSHLETNLFFVLDEATWAGDKKAEGRLKGIITGTRHNIERKGSEPYQVDNLCRVAILGNEDWMVPATHDERRFAVFSVGEGRMQDRKFFQDMREGMEAGGYQHLLRYLQDFDLSQVDVNCAPVTSALLDQKLQSLEPLDQWWLECLNSGKIAGGDFGGEWPAEVEISKLIDACARWMRGRNIRSRAPEAIAFGRRLKQLAPSYDVKVRATKGGHSTHRVRVNPGLDELRADFAAWMGQEMTWD